MSSTITEKTLRGPVVQPGDPAWADGLAVRQAPTARFRFSVLHARAAQGGFGLPGRAFRRGTFLDGRFTRRADVLRAGLGEDVLRLGNLPRFFGVNGKEQVAGFDFAFVLPGDEFRNPEIDQAPGDPSRGGADGRVTEEDSKGTLHAVGIQLGMDSSRIIVGRD